MSDRDEIDLGDAVRLEVTGIPLRALIALAFGRMAMRLRGAWRV